MFELFTSQLVCDEAQQEAAMKFEAAMNTKKSVTTQPSENI
jgi:hypothetical protein